MQTCSFSLKFKVIQLIPFFFFNNIQLIPIYEELCHHFLGTLLIKKTNKCNYKNDFSPWLIARTTGAYFYINLKMAYRKAIGDVLSERESIRRRQIDLLITS